MESDALEKIKKFDYIKSFFMLGIEKQNLESALNTENFDGNDEITKVAVEHAFRIYVLLKISNLTIEDMKRIVDMSIMAAEKKLCLPTLPIFVISDMLNSLTIDRCSEIFCYLEDSSHVWKSNLFYSSVKNYLLRMCNDLLKRLSKSQNTVFSGRIHLFLAKLFPLNEKSGLNLMSHFSDNVTRYTTSLDAFQEAINKNKNESMEVDDVDTEASQSIPIDYNLYIKFWYLQEVFSKPNICYEKNTWKTFTNNANEVLDALKSYRLEDVKDSAKTDEYDELYFSKYLTSEKLLDLQLNDSNFRRQILIQFLILFHYLNSKVKFKTATQVLNEEQSSWIKSTTKKINELLKETPPSGSKFLNNIKYILEREEIWNQWKNEGCPNYEKERKPSAPTKVPSKRPIKPTCSDFMLTNTSKVFVGDNSEISKLCNINHANLEACKDPNRQFLPSLEEFFEEVIEQLDPENQVEKEYQLIYQTDWAWKALRLLARRSSLYFMQNQNVKTIPEYLEAISKKLEKEFMGDKTQHTQHQTAQQQTSNERNADEHGANENFRSAEHISKEEDSNQDSEHNLNENKLSNEEAQSIIENENSQHGNDENAWDDDQQNIVNSSAQNEEMMNTDLNPIDEEQFATMDQDKPVDDSDLQASSDVQPTHVITQSKRYFDIDLIDFIAANINATDEWKQIAISLKLSDETISTVENETSEVKQQARRILQIWTEQEERTDLTDVFMEMLKSIANNELAEKFENKLNGNV